MAKSTRKAIKTDNGIHEHKPMVFTAAHPAHIAEIEGSIARLQMIVDADFHKYAMDTGAKPAAMKILEIYDKHALEVRKIGFRHSPYQATLDMQTQAEEHCKKSQTIQRGREKEKINHAEKVIDEGVLPPGYTKK